jgi:hypothetical protein
LERVVIRRGLRDIHGADRVLKLAKTEQILVSEEDMQRLALDNRPVRYYCLQCRGPKYMVPFKPNPSYQDALGEFKTPEKYAIVCKTCHTRYTAKLGSP